MSSAQSQSEKPYCPDSISTAFTEQELQSAADQSILHLLRYCDEENPVDAALNAISKFHTPANPLHLAQDFSRDVLHTLFVHALIRPNSYITTVFDAFYPRMTSFKHVIQVGLRNYARHRQADPVATLKLLGPSRLKKACVILSIDPNDVLLTSIAADDPDLFTLVCSTPEGGAYPYYKWESLARFDDAPSSRIMTQCYQQLGNQAEAEIRRARAILMRAQIDGSREQPIYLARHAPGDTPKMGFIPHQFFPPSDRGADFHYRSSEFKAWVNAHPVDAIKALYKPDVDLTIHTMEQWVMADEITQVVLSTDIPPGEIITFGPLNRGKHGMPAMLDEALNYLGHLNDIGFRFYVYIYLAYLKTFSIYQIIDACDGSGRSLQGAYKVLKDPLLLQAMDSFARDEVFTDDLGL